MTDADRSGAIAALDEAAIWVIERGIHLLQQQPDPKGADPLAATLAQRWGVALLAPPVIGGERYLALFQIGREAISHSIQALHRAWHDGMLHELWQVKVGSADPALPPQALFITTVADEPEDPRRVRRASRDFPGAIVTDDGKRLPLPLGSRSLIQDMQPWLFPASFLGSELAERGPVPAGDDLDHPG